MNVQLEIFFYFLKLGFTGFGGPVALAAIMQSELVEEKKWISREEFAQAFPLIKAMPGTLAAQTAYYLAYKRGGFLGALLAGIGLVGPASFMMVLLAILAPEMAQLDWVQPLLMGFQAGALSLITLACWQLSAPYRQIKIWWLYVLVTIALAFAHVPEPLLIFSFGLLNIYLAKRKAQLSSPKLLSAPIMELIFICVLASTVVFGTGLAAVPWLEKQMVFEKAWISQKEFLQAVAFGQITPGPVLVTATYIGYKVSGGMGALLASIFIYLPGLIHMTTWFPRMVTRLSKKTWIRDFSEGALGAVVGTLIYVIFKYVPSVGNIGIVIFLIASFILYRFKLPAWLVILGSGGLGFVLVRVAAYLGY